jgi:ABC-type amino acid transport substrate-binding protein
MALLAIFVVSFACSWGFHEFSEKTVSAPQKETALDRVLRTRTLRCAYLVYPPEIVKDPNTGKLSGYIVDIVEEIGRRLDVKIEWQTELGFGFQDVVIGLNANRFDAVCSGFVETPAHAKAALFSIPVDFGAQYVFVRTDDHRFDLSNEALNSSSVKIATIDGEIGQAVAKEVFPQATQVTLPEISDISVALETVATRKADAAIFPIATAKGYMEHNPGKLRALKNHPANAWIQPTMAFAHGENDLKYVVDATLRAMFVSGFIEKTFKRYDPDGESYLLPQPLYR